MTVPFSGPRLFLHPKGSFGSRPLSPEGLEYLNELAHKECFIADSVRTSATVEIDWASCQARGQLDEDSPLVSHAGPIFHGLPAALRGQHSHLKAGFQLGSRIEENADAYSILGPAKPPAERERPIRPGPAYRHDMRRTDSRRKPKRR